MGRGIKATRQYETLVIHNALKDAIKLGHTRNRLALANKLNSPLNDNYEAEKIKTVHA